jgi:tRNA threonylcarbamoyl adenosine modification protein YeaZ
VLLLGLDTSSPAVTVAVHDGERVVAAQTTVDARRHGELLAPSIESVLREAGVPATALTGIAVGVGPGPYTGLRIGVVTAVALADALDLPAYGVCSLDAIAVQAAATEPVTVVTDARRREVFWATYDSAAKRLSGPAVGRPADAAAAAVGRVVGAGAAMYPDAFGPGVEALHPRAGAVCAIAAVSGREVIGLLAAVPIYLRRPDAVVPNPPKSVSA